VTLALVAAVTAVTVALASFVVVRELRLRRATDEAIAQGEFNLAFAADALSTGAPDGSRTAHREAVSPACSRACSGGAASRSWPWPTGGRSRPPSR
jgi:hypothetical protein